MMKKNYKMKRTISVKQFVVEFGDSISKHMKQRLLELGERCILNRRDESHILDFRHVEHIKYECCCGSEDGAENKKEYAYGQLVVKEGNLYLTQDCVENEDIMQSPVVGEIYSVISSPEVQLEEGIVGKMIDESNIDYVIDNILKVCPKVSAEHMAIIAKYVTVDSAK
ncbi:MAG: hypothetical protein A2Y23_12740 [Clostridiales bacterium GWB2_37_7]|nr:MAG: hypothetical protein A2Y23_12740 [Clostridiales bacterium GWB2_37_7]